MAPDLNELWQKVLSKIKSHIENENFYESHIKNLILDSQVNNSFYVGVSSEFALSAIKSSYQDKFNEVITNLIGQNCQVYFLSPEELAKVKEENAKPAALKKKQEPVVFSNPFRKNMVFSNFVVGASNEDAFNATRLIAQKKQKWNLLFIYGNTGLGKTHLANALGNEYLKYFPNSRVLYISSDDFTREVFLALNGSKIEDLKASFKSCDLLIIEDIQFFTGRDKTNEIFFNIFNTMMEKDKVIFMTSDKSPDELYDFEKRMTSRFTSGLVIEVKQPNYEMMMNIIELKFAEMDVPFKISKEALKKIASTFDNVDIRKIEGILNRIYFFAITKYMNLTILDSEQIDEILQTEYQLINKELNKDPTVILEKVCLNYNISKDEVLSTSRTSETSTVRKICMYIYKNKLNMSLSEIAKFFNRNHSTVKTAIESAEELMSKDSALKNYINSVITK